MADIDVATVEHTHLRVFELAVARHLSRCELADVVDACVTLDEAADYLVAELYAHLAGRTASGREVRYPSTWWDAFKARWFPRWALRRWPPAYVVVTPELTEYFPDIRPLPGQRSIVVASWSEPRVEVERP